MRGLKVQIILVKVFSAHTQQHSSKIHGSFVLKYQHLLDEIYLTGGTNSRSMSHLAPKPSFFSS